MSLNYVRSPGFQQPPSPQRQYTPRRSRSRATSLANSVDQRLSIIDEDSPSPPQQSLHPPPEERAIAHNRPFSRRFGLGEPPKYKRGQSPPRYTFWDVTGPNGEKFEDIRNNAYIAKRGGWKRLCIIVWIILILLIALGVGIGVGLSSTKKENDSNTNPLSSSSSPSATPSGPFPAGSYTLTVYLSQISTNCTSSTSSWTCQPSTTYSTDPAGSKAQFVWLINPTGNNNFTISSANNLFTIDFKDRPLLLLDEGLATERYRFETTVQKVAYPRASFSTKCFYNNTLFAANLYTRKTKDSVPPAASSSPPPLRRELPEAGGLGKRQSNDYKEWPYAVDATQFIGGGQGVPDCYEYDASDPGNVGERVNRGENRGPGDFCSCVYGNWGLDNQE